MITKKTSPCFMKINDVYKTFPKFMPKETFEMINQDGIPTGELYVHCDEVKALCGNSSIWRNISRNNRVYYSWYHRESEVRLVFRKRQ